MVARHVAVRAHRPRCAAGSPSTVRTVRNPRHLTDAPCLMTQVVRVMTKADAGMGDGTRVTDAHNGGGVLMLGALATILARADSERRKRRDAGERSRVTPTRSRRPSGGSEGRGATRQPMTAGRVGAGVGRGAGYGSLRRRRNTRHRAGAIHTLPTRSGLSPPKLSLRRFVQKARRVRSTKVRSHLRSL